MAEVFGVGINKRYEREGFLLSKYAKVVKLVNEKLVEGVREYILSMASTSSHKCSYVEFNEKTIVETIRFLGSRTSTKN